MNKTDLEMTPDEADIARSVAILAQFGLKPPSNGGVLISVAAYSGTTDGIYGRVRGYWGSGYMTDAQQMTASIMLSMAALEQAARYTLANTKNVPAARGRKLHAMAKRLLANVKKLQQMAERSV